jgi:hypothetical protein
MVVAMRAPVAVTVVLAVLVLPLTPAVATGGSKPWHGVYDCYTYGYFGLTYLHSSRLKGDGTYQQAFDRHDGTLKNPTSGKWAYKASKKKIVFKTGAFKSIYGHWNKPSKDHPKGSYTEQMKDGSGSPGTCYPTKYK